MLKEFKYRFYDDEQHKQGVCEIVTALNQVQADRFAEAIVFGLGMMPGWDLGTASYQKINDFSWIAYTDEEGMKRIEMNDPDGVYIYDFIKAKEYGAIYELEVDRNQVKKANEDEWIVNVSGVKFLRKVERNGE